MTTKKVKHIELVILFKQGWYTLRAVRQGPAVSSIVRKALKDVNEERGLSAAIRALHDDEALKALNYCFSDWQHVFQLVIQESPARVSYWFDTLDALSQALPRLRRYLCPIVKLRPEVVDCLAVGQGQ